MQDTRETRFAWSSKMTDKNTSPRFKVGDKLLIPHNGKLISQTVHNVFWNKDFGGWLVCCDLIGVHEQNYIHESEKEGWIPHENGLWSWWQRKNKEGDKHERLSKVSCGQKKELDKGKEEKMTPQKAIVDYMWYKSDLLGGRQKYMLKSIEKDILKWSDNDAKNVCKKIIYYLTNCTELWIPLAGKACPYCLYTTCSHCFYGKVRGICSERGNSVYQKLNRYQDGWNNKKAIKILKKGL